MAQFQYIIHGDSATDDSGITGHVFYEVRKVENDVVTDQQFFGKNQAYGSGYIERNPQLQNRDTDISKVYTINESQYNQWVSYGVNSVQNDASYNIFLNNCADYIQKGFTNIMGGKFTSSWSSQELSKIGFAGDYIQFKYGSSNQIPYDNFNLKMSRWENSGMAETVYGSYGPYQYTPIKGSFAADYFKPNSNIQQSIKNLGSVLNHKSPLAIDLDGDGIESVNMKDGVFFDIKFNGYYA